MQKVVKSLQLIKGKEAKYQNILSQEIQKEEELRLKEVEEVNEIIMKVMVAAEQK